MANSSPLAASAAPDLSGQVVIVTGGARGIGRGITEGFLTAGAEVTICGRSEPESLPSVDGRTAAFVAADVREPDDVERVVAETVQPRRSARRAGEQRGRLASGRLGHGLPALLALDHRPEPGRTPGVRAEGQRGHAGPGVRWLHRQHRERERDAPLAWRARPTAPRRQGCSTSPRRSRSTTRRGVRVNAVTAGLIVTEQAHLFYGDEEGIAAVGATVPLGRMGTPQRRRGGLPLPRVTTRRLRQRGEHPRARRWRATRLPRGRQEHECIAHDAPQSRSSPRR